MNRKIIVFAGLFLSVALLGCAPRGFQKVAVDNSAPIDGSLGTPEVVVTGTLPASQAGAQGDDMLEVSEEQNGSQLALVVNDTFKVVLDGNPSTGYLWEPEDLDAARLEQQGEPQFQASGNMKGSGGKVMLTFKALKAGTTRLRLVYHRPFEKGAPAERLFELRIDIQE